MCQIQSPGKGLIGRVYGIVEEREGESVYMECSGWLHAQLFEAFPWRSGPVEVQVLAVGAQEPHYHLFFFFFSCLLHRNAIGMDSEQSFPCFSAVLI